MRTISDKGLNLLIEWEGERLEAYDDARPNVKLAPGDKVLGCILYRYNAVTSSVGCKDQITVDKEGCMVLQG